MTAHTRYQSDTPRSFWRDLEEEAASHGLKPATWYHKAKQLALDAGKHENDFVSKSNFRSYWLTKRVRLSDWHWGDGVQFFVQAVVGLNEPDWKPWHDRWKDLRGPGEDGHNTHKGTHEGRHLDLDKRYVLATAIIGLIAAIATLVATLTPDRGGAAESERDQPSTASPYNPPSTSGAQGKVDDIARGAQTEQELIDKLHAKATAPPVGNGPWVFVVVDTQKEGVFARSTNETIADRLGFATEHSVVFAECQTQSSFTPPGVRRDVGPVWLRVLWKNRVPSTGAFQSDPSDPYRVWMYRGYLEPFEQNGQLPQCS